MQIHDDQSDHLSNASDISKASSILETSSLKDDNDDDSVTQTLVSLENESDVTGTPAQQQPAAVDIEEGIPIEKTPEVAQEVAGTDADGQGEEEVRESDV